MLEGTLSNFINDSFLLYPNAWQEKARDLHPVSSYMVTNSTDDDFFLVAQSYPNIFISEYHHIESYDSHLNFRETEHVFYISLSIFSI